MKKIKLQLSDFAYLQKTMSGILLKQAEILKAFSVLSTALLLVYLLIFKAFNFMPDGLMAQAIVFSPLLASTALLMAVYSNRYVQAMFIITWVMPALMVLASFANPADNYSRIIVIYMLVVLFLNNTKQKRLTGFIYQALAYSVIQLRYYSSGIQQHDERMASIEMAMVPVFCIVMFVILARVKKEFALYHKQVKERKEDLEEKNDALENLYTFSEQQRNKLKKTVLLKEKLISIISHDVRVPLNSFRFLIDGYEKGLFSKEMVMDGIIETKKDLVNMDKMVMDLVNWARTGKDADENALITGGQMEEIMESALSIYTLCAKNKKLDIVTSIDMPAGMSLAISKPEIEIIIRNLLSNAIKYSTADNKIIVSLQAQNGIATLKVKDQGTGIHPSTLKRLNDNRVESTMGTLDEIGLGVGLSLVFDVINNRSLTYDIQSVVGEGTGFSINIPMV